MKRALISVYDKRNLERAARLLQDHGWEIVSTGGTARHLRDAGVKVIDAADLTGIYQLQRDFRE